MRLNHIAPGHSDFISLGLLNALAVPPALVWPTSPADSWSVQPPTQPHVWGVNVVCIHFYVHSPLWLVGNGR